MVMRSNLSAYHALNAGFRCSSKHSTCVVAASIGATHWCVCSSSLSFPRIQLVFVDWWVEMLWGNPHILQVFKAALVSATAPRLQCWFWSTLLTQGTGEAVLEAYFVNMRIPSKVWNECGVALNTRDFHFNYTSRDIGMTSELVCGPGGPSLSWM